MKIKLFGFLGSVIAPELELDLPDFLTKKIILATLAEKYPTYQADFDKCNVAVNQVYIVDEEVDKAEVMEIAVIPPVSGG